MTDVTRILSAIEQGDPHAAARLLPLVYEELRKLAAQKLAQEKPGQTMEATALVHEAYLRLVDTDQVPHWNSRGHFFAAADPATARGRAACRKMLRQWVQAIGTLIACLPDRKRDRSAHQVRRAQVNDSATRSGNCPHRPAGTFKTLGVTDE
jgi:hypothetical protein